MGRIRENGLSETGAFHLALRLHRGGGRRGLSDRPELSAAGQRRRCPLLHNERPAAAARRPSGHGGSRFLVGLDIVGDRILEIDVFTPGGVPDIAGMTGVDFSQEIIAALEEKVAIRKACGLSIDNRALATL